MGKFQGYMSVTEQMSDFMYDSFKSLGDQCTRRWELELDPLSLAIAKGNGPIVEMLTEGADTSLLCREWAIPGLAWRHGMDHGRIRMTPLHLAIWMGEYEAARILLQRFAEVDQTTLEWDEPAGLGLASYLGNVDIVRLMLEGQRGAVPESPWAARIRSQLLDPRAYGKEHGRHYYYCDRLSHSPPMIMVSSGAGSKWHPPGGEAIFAILAAYDPHLVTKKYSYPGRSNLWPLRMSVWVSRRSETFSEASILALIRAGALEPSLQPAPTATSIQPQRGEEEEPKTPHQLLLSTSLTKEHKWRTRRTFIGKCWDAALEYHGGTADDEFLKSWDEDIGDALPTKPLGKVGRTPKGHKKVVWEMTMILDIISALERKHPGFAKLPTIRRYLDGVIFHRRNRSTFNHADLEGDWSHLMA